MLDYILILFMVIPFILLLWLVLFLMLHTVFDLYDIDFSKIFNRKEVDIPDFVNSYSYSELNNLFKERR